ncbi:MAG TPA: OmpA family protein [Candidatus Kapabacteria bacterium]|nr:OmpA family protein [Candidatus Kapabacteria bacterium]
MNNIFFDTGKSDLKEESFPELKRVKSFMADNPSYEIEVSGHTDNIGKANENQTLSEQRAKSVYDYLLSLGVPAKRLKTKGYGSSKPLTNNSTEQGRSRNRRVEFIIQKQ